MLQFFTFLHIFAINVEHFLKIDITLKLIVSASGLYLAVLDHEDFICQM